MSSMWLVTLRREPAGTGDACGLPDQLMDEEKPDKVHVAAAAALAERGAPHFQKGLSASVGIPNPAHAPLFNGDGKTKLLANV